MDGLISVIIPVYKVEEFLDKCLESIVNQTYTNLEIILVDDGSPDSCPTICDNWAAKDSRIVVVHKANAGAGFARNSGLDIAKGEYVCFVDPDDWMPLDSLMLMYNRSKADHSDLVIGQKTIAFFDGTQQPPADHFDPILVDRSKTIQLMQTNSKLLNCFIWGKLYKRSIFSDIRFTNLILGEDLQIWPLVLERCDLISVIPETIYFYFQRETSLVHTITEEKYMDHIKACLMVADFYAERKRYQISKRYFRGAMGVACTFQQKKAEARRLINAFFWKTETLRMKDVKTLVLWINLYFPVYSFMRKVLGWLEKQN